MFGDAWLLGHGTGQFRYEYPRYRSEREIDLSTDGWRFHALPRTAHNDPLEILADKRSGAGGRQQTGDVLTRDHASGGRQQHPA